MSTRCTIAIELKNCYKSIYCHFDGYKSYTGATLQKFYNDPEKVEKLIKIGNISQLKQDMEKIEFYNEKAKRTKTMQDLYNWAYECGCEYLYIYIKKHKWLQINLHEQ